MWFELAMVYGTLTGSMSDASVWWMGVSNYESRSTKSEKDVTDRGN